MSEFDMENINTFLSTGTKALDLVQKVLPLVPKGNREEAENALRDARQKLDLAKAEAAKSLGHMLCQCTFPPQIMLWSEPRKAHICPNIDCGRIENQDLTKPRAPGAACPRCGAYEFRTDKITHDTGAFRELGAFNRHMKCGDCGHQETTMDTGRD